MLTPEVVMDLFAEAFYLTILMLLVIIGPGLIVGLIVSMFQAATQINEQTLSFLPRLIVTIISLMIAGPWLLTKFMDLFNRLFSSVPSLIG
ncbi:flagellar biosynthetic protein FliQ [Cellvibrio mixtus]|jgi:flagellar biosynthetic protein FliQ|uniref:Flagellar biosynthetic protein FliQ n=1 Tax=Cellvibrio mixtus TaxID=39650 RepID=A0A266Q519_9GAMM|nr:MULTISPECIES: flagellar biosynthesis protein FliQ [Cellvibrio]AQT59366.1 flagellar biosynthetic protein FliQ [Cellvibrio sp. PSBB023]OZY84974.1 flagellar biosynthetic protein FliQ [Cellvibrio mixtus]